jgi:hypothetical protein
MQVLDAPIATTEGEMRRVENGRKDGITMGEREVVLARLPRDRLDTLLPL